MLNVAKLIKPCYIDRQHIVAVLNVKTVDFFLSFLEEALKSSLRHHFVILEEILTYALGYFFKMTM